MKAITGYLALLCISLTLTAVIIHGVTPRHSAAKQSVIKTGLDARKAALAELEEL